MKYTIWVPVKTAPLWYAIDLSVRVGLAVVGLAMSGLNAFCAAAGSSAVRTSAKAIAASRMSFVFMTVLLTVLVYGADGSAGGCRQAMQGPGRAQCAKAG